ncbi:MAG: hypothetical protein Q9220_003767 [cf. Caloplaca sp. 1 TL-2023]
MASENSKPITLKKIPTLSQLYRSGKLSYETVDFCPYQPSAALNDKVSLIQTSITDLEVTSIVNAANTSLLGGGGVDGAIHGAAGPDLLKECRTLDGCRTGSAKITSAYDLPSKHVIHAVGPIYLREEQRDPGRATDLLTSCYRTSLELAADKGGSIAFSCLSTGVYGYPSDEAADVACQTVRDFLATEQGNKLDRVIFCCFLDKDMREYEENMPVFFPPTLDDDPAMHKTSRNGSEEVANPNTQDVQIHHEFLETSAVDEPESDTWVELDKSDISPGSPKLSGGTSSEAVKTNLQNTDNDVKETSADSSERSNALQHNQHVGNTLLKDW